MSGQRLLILIWLSLFTVALAWLARSEPEPTLPRGWQRWTDTGALYALIPFGKGVLAGGVQGLWYVEGRRVMPFSPDGLPEAAVVFALAQKRGGDLWVGHSGGLSICHDGRWKRLSEVDGIPRSPVKAIALGADGGWIGGRDGLFWVRGQPEWSGRMQDFSASGGRQAVRRDRISALMVDASGGLWVGTNEAPNGGVYRMGAGGVRFWGMQEGLPHPQVTSFMQDHAGRVWAGVGFHDRGGAAVFEGDTASGWRLSFTLGKGQLAGSKVRSLAQDLEGLYWIGSENNGVAIRSEKETLAILRKEHGLPGMEVTGILQTENRAVWLATLKGLVRIDRSALPEPRSLKMR